MKNIKIELNTSNASGEAYWRKRCDVVEAELSRLRAANAAKDAEIENLKEKLQELKKTLLRWAKTSEEMEKETGKIEYHYCATNYRIEVLAINTVLGKDGK